MIKKEGNQWKLYSKDGSKVLSSHDTKEEAEHREKQVNFFKALESHPEIAKKKSLLKK